jgi:hypothetical protein
MNHIRNLSAPQGIGFAPESNQLAVANDGDGSLRLYDGTSLRQTASVDLKDDADNVRYDPVSHDFWVGCREGGLAEIDPESGRLADMKLNSTQSLSNSKRKQPDFRESAERRSSGCGRPEDRDSRRELSP